MKFTDDEEARAPVPLNPGSPNGDTEFNRWVTANVRLNANRVLSSRSQGFAAT
jgi:hypothetical protein